MDGYSRVVGICGLLQMPDPNAGDLLRKKCNPSNESTPHDSQISSTTEPSDVKEVTHAIYAVYMIHLGKLQLFRGRPESGVIYIPEH